MQVKKINRKQNNRKQNAGQESFWNRIVTPRIGIGSEVKSLKIPIPITGMHNAVMHLKYLIRVKLNEDSF